MWLMSGLPVAWLSSLLITWIGLALAALGVAMREPVMTTSSTSGGALVLCAAAGGGACALAAPAKHSAGRVNPLISDGRTRGSGRGAAQRGVHTTTLPIHRSDTRAALIDVSPSFDSWSPAALSPQCHERRKRSDCQVVSATQQARAERFAARAECQPYRRRATPTTPVGGRAFARLPPRTRSPPS